MPQVVELTSYTCREVSTLARFNPRGDLIYVGTSRGNIHIWDVVTKQVRPGRAARVHSETHSLFPRSQLVWTDYVGAATAVKHLEFNSAGTCVPFPPLPHTVGPSRRRTLLQRHCPQLERPLHPLHHAVVGASRTAFGRRRGGRVRAAARAAFSDPLLRGAAQVPGPRQPHAVERVRLLERRRVHHRRCVDPSSSRALVLVVRRRDIDAVDVAGAGHKGAHNIYIWDRVTGALAKILEGPKDPCEDLTVRPTLSPSLCPRSLYLSRSRPPSLARSGTRSGP